MTYTYLKTESFKLFQELYTFRLLRTDFIHRLTGAGKFGTRKQLTRRWKQGYTDRPIAQRRAYNSLYTQRIHSLTPKGLEVLNNLGACPYRAVPETTRRKEFAHQMMISDVLASIKIGCLEHGLKFIPHEQITDEAEVDIKVQMPFSTTFRGVKYEGTLTPDAIFALEYPDGTRSYFVLETENYSPLDPDKKPYRSSLKKKVVGYRDINRKKTYKEFGLKNMRVLIVAGTPLKVKNRVQWLEKNFGESKLFLFTDVPVQENDLRSPQPFPELLTVNWQRAGLEPTPLFHTSTDF